MSNHNSRQLIEHISDQYVLMASNPEEAFAREAQKKKKNRRKKNKKPFSSRLSAKETAARSSDPRSCS